MQTNLMIDAKMREMIRYGYIALRQFPKSEKHCLGAEIRNTMWSLQRLVITAIKRFHKKTTLTDMDIELSLLKRQVRAAKDLQFIDLKKYETWCRQMVEIGKMLGGWIKSIRAKASPL